MRHNWIYVTLLSLGLNVQAIAGVTPGTQKFQQEVSRRFTNGLPPGPVQLLECPEQGALRAFSNGKWYGLTAQNRSADREQAKSQAWEVVPGSEVAEGEFSYLESNGTMRKVKVPWASVRQLARGGNVTFLATTNEVFWCNETGAEPLGFAGKGTLHQIAVSDAVPHVASSSGSYTLKAGQWSRLAALDTSGRDWASGEVLAVTFDRLGNLWVGTKAGAGCRTGAEWKFWEGKNGLPYNDFTCAAPGAQGEVWFGTRLGAIRYDSKGWHYRQGPAWLASDEILQVVADPEGCAWFATSAGVSCIERHPMSLAEKAEVYEYEIEKYVKRTPYGFVAEAALRVPAERTSASPNDSDNDGLWTAMYGAGECFAYGATKQARHQERAKKAFEALRFLQKVTQGGSHSPPAGYIARTVRPIDWPDPNAGRLEQDRDAQKRDRLWKVYEPRWPKSVDGKWYWKSDTSSDELDGHYFFYPLYYEFCAETEDEKERVRDVVRGITDHLITHDYCLIDHDGKPTRWGIYGPKQLNGDPDWWQERGLKSLSMLSYLEVAAYITEDPKYHQTTRELVERHGYAQNAMHPKVQHGPGSGNQSDDEMAFMCFYNLLRYSKDEPLKSLIRVSFFRYWANEAQEMNPFFNFAYAAPCLEASGMTPFGDFPLTPWTGWHEDSMATLYGFSLDRLDWPHRNSHRLDIVTLRRVAASDFSESDQPRQRGYRTNGKVLPVENRHFGHWNTDPWRLDYNGGAHELSAGTVFLLPYYMGLYHGFIENLD